MEDFIPTNFDMADPGISEFANVLVSHWGKPFHDKNPSPSFVSPQEIEPIASNNISVVATDGENHVHDKNAMQFVQYQDMSLYLLEGTLEAISAESGTGCNKEVKSRHQFLDDTSLALQNTKSTNRRNRIFNIEQKKAENIRLRNYRRRMKDDKEKLKLELAEFKEKLKEILDLLSKVRVEKEISEIIQSIQRDEILQLTSQLGQQKRENCWRCSSTFAYVQQSVSNNSDPHNYHPNFQEINEEEVQESVINFLSDRNDFMHGDGQQLGTSLLESS